MLYPLCILFDIFVLASGEFDGLMPQGGGISVETLLIGRFVYNSVLILTHTLIMMAGINMRKLQSYSGCRTGAILAIVFVQRSAMCLAFPLAFGRLFN